MEAIQPYVTEIVQALLGVLVLLVMAMLQMARKRVEAWLAAHTSVSQRELLQKIGQEAFAHAETVYKGMGGEVKLQGAYRYASSKLEALGVDMSTAEIQAVIHKAWLEHQAQVKPGTLSDGTTSSDMKPFNHPGEG